MAKTQSQPKLQNPSSAAPELPAKPSSNFHLSFLFLSRPQREAMATFYEYCRLADDLVDEVALVSVEEARLGLRELRAEVERIFAGTATTILGWKLLRAHRRYGFERKDLLDIVRGCEMDLDTRRYQTFDDLREYCYCVASAVGLVSIRIFGCEHPESREYAINLGLAFQLTNILRDIQEDAARDRIYLPLEDLRRFHVTEADLLAGRGGHGFADLMKCETERALNFYRAAERHLAARDARKLIAAQIMRSVYFEIWRRIRENPQSVLHGRIEIPRRKKLRLALLAFLESYVR